MERLVWEFINVFAWSYDVPKLYEKSTIKHAIPLKEGAWLHRQKLRNVNLKLAPLVQKELQKMVDAKIIAPIKYSEWISNMVPSRNKKCDIRLFVDFRNLNSVSEKDKYYFPNMDLLLQRITSS